MRVRFWGTRGSLATPGPGTVHYGGNTSCVELTTFGGQRFIIDCGTGARLLGADWMLRGRQSAATILLSHTHWDHIQGFPFFAPVFAPGNHFTVCAPSGGGRSLDKVLAGQMEFTYFPVDLGQLPASIVYRELSEGAYEMDGVRVLAQYLNHPAMTLGYRLEADGASVVYLCDHEPLSDTLWRSDAEPGHLDSILHAGDRRHAAFMADADLVIHDAQYTPEEYPAKKNWGHSPFEYVVELASAAGARQLALTHHDPMHDDAFLDQVEERARALAHLRGRQLDVFCAAEGDELGVFPHQSDAEFPHPVLGPAAAVRRRLRILIVDDEDSTRCTVKDALVMDGHVVMEACGGQEGLRLAEETSPDLILLDMHMLDIGGIELVKTLKAKQRTASVPVLMLTSNGQETATRAGFEAGATDYLIRPFSIPQLHARVRACFVHSDKRSAN
ncbi:MAG: response regulator [Acidobacteriota bacterium]|nr:response regulator [Acidobacteriota bacterium]